MHPDPHAHVCESVHGMAADVQCSAVLAARDGGGRSREWRRLEGAWVEVNFLIF
jgi:hypothetical protein